MFTPTQLKIAFGGLTVIGLLAVYVPWNYTIQTSTIHREKPAGYHPLFDPPKPEDNIPRQGVRVDWTGALVPMAVVALAAAVGVAAARPRPTAVKNSADVIENPVAPIDGLAWRSRHG